MKKSIVRILSMCMLATMISLTSAERVFGDTRTIPRMEASSVFNDSGNFVVSYGMLDRKISQITFPATHNSFANDADGQRDFGAWYENQGISIKSQLEQGIRWLDMDLGPGDALGAAGGPVYFVHNSGTGGRANLGETLTSIKQFVESNRDVVFVFEMSDVNAFSVDYAYGKLREAFYSTGLSEYVYNMKPASQKKNNANDIYTDQQHINPTLRTVLEANKNIIFVPHVNYYTKDRVFVQEVDARGNTKADYSAVKAPEVSSVKARYNPDGINEQSRDANRLMTLDFTPDDGAKAGSRFFAARNNDGRRIYQLAKWFKNRMPNDKRINALKVDYFGSSKIGGNNNQVAYDSVVDAANQLNKESYGFNTSEDKLLHMPQQNDLIRSTAEIKNEVSYVRRIAGQNKLGDIQNYHKDGWVKSSGRRRLKQGSSPKHWWGLPEFAADGDYTTSWEQDGKGWIEFNLGSSKMVNSIQIVWEFNHANPGFKVMGSNGGGNWVELLNRPKQRDKNTNVYEAPLKRGSYKYIRVQTTDVDGDARTGIAEIFIR